MCCHIFLEKYRKGRSNPKIHLFWKGRSSLRCSECAFWKWHASGCGIWRDDKDQKLEMRWDLLDTWSWERRQFPTSSHGGESQDDLRKLRFQELTWRKISGHFSSIPSVHTCDAKVLMELGAWSCSWALCNPVVLLLREGMWRKPQASAQEGPQNIFIFAECGNYQHPVLCSLCILCRLCWSQCLMCCVYEICNMYAGCSVHSAVLNSVGSVPAERWTGVEAALLPVASLLLLLLLLPNASCTTALPGHRHRYTLQPSSHVLSNSLLIELDFLSSPYFFEQRHHHIHHPDND